MSEFFPNIPEIKFEGKDSKNPLAFKYYDAKKVIMGKTMEEHLNFAMAWWHNLCANGVDMFGTGTADKSFGAVPSTLILRTAALPTPPRICSMHLSQEWMPSLSV